MKNTIQQAAQNKPAAVAGRSVNQILNGILDGENMRRRFDELLGKRAPQFISSLITLVNATPDLQQAVYESPATVIQAALKAATYDLPIDQSLGYAYIVPFKNTIKQPDGSFTKRMDASFIIGWKGMNQLAMRTGAYKTINVLDVREGELMKSRYVRPYSKRELKAMGETAERQTRRSLEKVQWVMIVALNDALGVGEERFLRVFDRYTELLEEYGGFEADDVADEMLSRRVTDFAEKLY